MTQELYRTEPDDETLDYYLTPNDGGWMLVMRRGDHLSLTQQFESVSAAITRAEVITAGVELHAAS